MKVWAVFLVVINCGGSYNDSLELHGIYSDPKVALDEAHAAEKLFDLEAIIEEWPLQ